MAIVQYHQMKCWTHILHQTLLWAGNSVVSQAGRDFAFIELSIGGEQKQVKESFVNKYIGKKRKKKECYAPEGRDDFYLLPL